MKRILWSIIVVLVLAGVMTWAADPWTEVASLNVPRYKNRAVVLDGKIYVIGGRTVDKTVAPVEVYDPATNTWTVIGPCPDNAYEMPCAAAVGGKIYVLAGRTSDKVRPLVGFVWDPAGGEVTWTKVPGAPTMGHGDAGCGVIGTKIYLISGEDDTLSNEGFDYVHAVDVFDTATLTWSTVAPIEYGREDFDAIAVGPNIVVVGGQGGPDNAPIAWLDIYNVETDTWQHFDAATPFPWEHPRLAVIGDQVNVLTGKAEGGFFHFQLNIDTLTWAELTPPPIPIFECAVVVLDGKIYVIGGKDFDGNTLGTVLVYDPGQDG